MKTAKTPFELEAEVFNAIAHPVRLEILDLLKDGEACVCHIQAMLNLRQAYISQHLNVLRQAGLVESRKDGVRVYYQVNDPAIFSVIEETSSFLQALGKWSSASQEQNENRKPCHCPQCAASPSC